MTKIVIATIMRPTGETGVQTHVNNFRHYLNEKKIKHELVTPFSYYKLLVYPVFAIRKILNPFFGVASVWWYRYWHAYFLRLALRQYLQSGEACVVYTQCPLSADAALRARVSLKQRVVMVTHFNVSQADEWVGKNLINKDSCIYRSIQNFEAEVLPKLDALVFVSRFMQQELSRRIPAIGTVPFSVVPNFLPDPGEPAIRESVRDLISIGTLEARKNQEYLLEIIAALQESGNPLTLTIVGDGPDRSMLENKTRMLNIDKLVHFAGFVSNAADQIGLHRACIHVATIENLPITLIEAIARGRPIFAAAVGGVSEVLGEDVAGMALPLNDAQFAARIIAQAMGNQEWMLKTGIAGRERFLQNYASSVIAKKLIEFLEVCGQYSENGA